MLRLLALLFLSLPAFAGSGTFPTTNFGATLALDTPPPGATKLLVRTTGGTFDTSWGYEWTPLRVPQSQTLAYVASYSVGSVYNGGTPHKLYSARVWQDSVAHTTLGFDGSLDFAGSSGFTRTNAGALNATSFVTYTFPSGQAPTSLKLDVGNSISVPSGNGVTVWNNILSVSAEWEWQ